MAGNWTTLIAVDELAHHLGQCIVVDCRHDLNQPQYGRASWVRERIPGSFFLHQDEDLSGLRTGSNGRHPLPDPVRLRARLRALGVQDAIQLVACDEGDGMCAARLWWLARWLGHERVAVLDGGLAAWREAGQALDHDPPAERSTGGPPPEAVKAGGPTDRPAPLTHQVDAAQILARLDGDQPWCIVDARAPERWRGEMEPFDPVAGRIPGSLNRPHACNLAPGGRFKPAAALRAEFVELLAGRPPRDVVHHCGSGITACHNLLAMEVAGLPGSFLYPGSWSEWCADPGRPVATGQGNP